MRVISATVYIATEEGWWQGEKILGVGKSLDSLPKMLTDLAQDCDSLIRLYRIAPTTDIGIYLESAEWPSVITKKGQLAAMFREMMEKGRIHWSFDRNPQPHMVTTDDLLPNSGQVP